MTRGSAGFWPGRLWNAPLDVAEGFLLSYFFEMKQESGAVVSVMDKVDVSFRERNSREVPPIPQNMVFVQGGKYDAVTNAGHPNEDFRHEVVLNDFYIGQYETTQLEWEAVMGTLPENLDYGEGDDYPVYNVSWEEAVEYCNRRSLQEGLSPCYYQKNGGTVCFFEANGYRLPVEAEWEYAANGGPNTAYIGTRDSGWYSRNSNGTVHPVGLQWTNALNVFDMVGNVWEWCWEWYGETGDMKIIKGAAWNSPAEDLSYLDRGRVYPDEGMASVGFRVVRSAR